MTIKNPKEIQKSIINNQKFNKLILNNMKTNKFWLGAFVFLSMGMMASCSNEEPATSGGTTEQTGDKYMAVRISPVSENGTRTVTNQDDPLGAGFEQGVGTENDISAENTRFYFFTDKYEPFLLSAGNVSGAVSPSNMVKPTSLSQYNQNGDKTSTINGVLVLGKAADQGYVGKTPTYVICAANLSDVEFTNLANKSMEDVYNVIISRETSNSGLFKMTSSTYLKENSSNTDGGYDRVFASEITDNVYENMDDAVKNPVEIYIERLAVKVRTTGLGILEAKQSSADGATNDYTFIDENGNSVTKNLSVDLTGWQLCNTTTSGYAFKHIATGINYFDGWNTPDYHRCHWAITPPAATLQIHDDSYDIYTDAQFTLGNYNADDATKNIAYTYPNTSYSGFVGNSDYSESVEHPASLTDRTDNVNATAVVIRGVVGTVATDESGNQKIEPLNMVRWAGSLYETNVFKAMIARQYDIENGNEVGTTTVDNVRFDTQIESGENKTDANKHVARIVVGNSSSTYPRFNNIEEWKDGVTSFYLNIQHDSRTDGTPIYGVVRNHIYEHNVTGVVGLGVPGNERENPTDDEETFVACRLNVLTWGVVKNDVVLQ